MKAFIPCILLATALCGCRSHKEVTKSTSSDIDSVSVKTEAVYIASIDSAFRRLDMDFDTLKVTIRHDSAELSPVVEIRAVNGRVISRSRQYRDAVKASERLDTVAYKVASNEAASEHTSTTAVYDPPNTVAVIGIFAALILAGVAVYLFIKRH